MSPKFFRHARGSLGGQPLILEHWEHQIVGTMFGWKRPNGLRRYRDAYIEIARGNGKSTLCAVIAGNLMYLDDEPGAEIIGNAASRDQAREVFNVFKQSVALSPALSRISVCYKNSVERIDKTTGLPTAVYKVASAEAGTAHGGSAHGVIFDELHTQKNRDLWDVMQSSRIKRAQPLTVAITTAGHDRQSICYEQRQYAENVISGAITDPSFLPVIYAADPGDDWTKPEVWAKANPNLGVSIKESDLAHECKKAQTSPGYTNTFKRLHLNIWTELETLALDMERWDTAFPLYVETPAEWRARMLEELIGETCYAGLDLASKIDVAAFVLWFPEKRVILPWFFVPSDACTKRSADPSNKGRYVDWVSKGFMMKSNGSRIDYDQIKEVIKQAQHRFHVADIALDPWNGEEMRQQIERDGGNIIEFGQTIGNFTDATKELIVSVLERSIDHGHNPVMRWMASNLSIYQDANDNMRPDKKKSADKIDGMVALIMAMAIAQKQPQQPKVSGW